MWGEDRPVAASGCLAPPTWTLSDREPEKEEEEEKRREEK